MNLLLTIATVANPVLTALLTVLVFLESKKSKKQIEDIKNSINLGNESIVTSIDKQKDDFTKLAERLEYLSKETEESAKNFIEISDALTSSSAVSKEALGKVTTGLANHATKVSSMVDDLTAKVTETSAESIKGITEKVSEAMNDINTAVSKIEISQSNSFTKLTESNEKSLSGLMDKVSEAMNDINNAVSKIETSQDNLNINLTDSLSKLAANTESANKSVSSLKESLKNMVSLTQ